MGSDLPYFGKLLTHSHEEDFKSDSNVLTPAQ